MSRLLLFFCLLVAIARAELEPTLQLGGAIATGKLDTVRQVLSSHPEVVNQLDRRGHTPLQLAIAARSDPALVRLLLQLGARPDLAGRSGMTPLASAIQLNQSALCEVLLQGGADPNLGGLQKMTPLHWAAMQTDPAAGVQLVNLLIRYRANPNALDADGSTPLHRVLQRAMQKDAQVAPLLEALIAGGANPNQKMSFAESGVQVSPLEMARKLNLTRCAEVLGRAGAR